MEIEQAAQPEPDRPAPTPARRRSGSKKGRVESQSGDSTRQPFPLWALVRALATVVAPVALLYALLDALLSRGVDLIAFVLSLVAVATLVVLVWGLHTVYLILDGQRRQWQGVAAAAKPDPLARFAALPIWRDSRMLQLLAGAVAANLTVFAYVSAKYASLPPFLPLHYSATGDVDRLGTPPEVFMMPAIGLVVLVTNVLLSAALYRRERLASHLLVGASIFVQIVLLVATANIVARA